jgi:hypothetical protein
MISSLSQTGAKPNKIDQAAKATEQVRLVGPMQLGPRLSKAANLSREAMATCTVKAITVQLARPIKSSVGHLFVLTIMVPGLQCFA